MTIKLQDLVSELKLEDKLTPGTKTALSSLKGLAVGVGAVTAALGVVAVGFQKVMDITFDWANRLDSVQDIMGGTAKQAAAFNFVLEKSGTDVGQFTQGMTILEKGLVKADGSLDTTGRKLQEFGINVLDANGQVKNQADLVGEISNKYNQFGTQQERVNFLTETFGKSGAGLIDFFDTLAAEGGLDKATEKVEKLGLVIDPEKYEQFQRSMREVELAGKGLAVTFGNLTMPVLSDLAEWLVNSGIPFITSWTAKLQESGLTGESVSKSWVTNVLPVLEQLGRLFTNLNGIMERLDPSTDRLAGKFTALGAIQRVAVAVATIINGVLDMQANALRTVNDALETGIHLWDAFKRGMNQIRNIVIPTPSTSSGGNRATGGAVLGGTGYNVVELNRPEVFTPFTAGRIDPAKPQTVVAQIDETRLGSVIATELAKVMG